jgi:hypothetical protein
MWNQASRVDELVNMADERPSVTQEANGRSIIFKIEWTFDQST